MKKYKRRFLRLHTAIDVWFGIEGVFRRTDERISIIGAGGAYVESRRRFQPGEEVVMRFRLQEGQEMLTCRALVRSYNPGQGVGVEFTDLPLDDRQRIRAYVENQIISRSLNETMSGLLTRLKHTDQGSAESTGRSTDRRSPGSRATG
ncbi:MAG: PilZ domain-containing protein [Blastocatellia bacterium]